MHRTRPVASPGTGIDPWGSAEFAARDDQHIVEHSALMQIFNERGEGLIKDRQTLSKIFRNRSRDQIAIGSI